MGRCRRARSRGQAAASAGQRATGRREGLHRSLRERRRLPGDALIPGSNGLEVGRRLLEEVPVRHRLGCLVPGGRSAGGRNRGWTWWLTESQEDLLDGCGLGDEGGDTHVRAAVGKDQRQGVEQPWPVPIRAAWPRDSAPEIAGCPTQQRTVVSPRRRRSCRQQPHRARRRRPLHAGASWRGRGDARGLCAAEVLSRHAAGRACGPCARECVGSAVRTIGCVRNSLADRPPQRRPMRRLALAT